MRRFNPWVVVAAVAVLLVGTPTGAEPKPRCSGTDFRDGAAADRERLKDAEEEAKTIRNGEGTLWRLEPKVGGESSYILGVLRVLDPRAMVESDAKVAAFDAARTLAFEIPEFLENGRSIDFSVEDLDHLLFTDGTTLLDHLTEPDRDSLRSALSLRKVPLWLVAGFRPWLIWAAILQSTPCEYDRHHGYFDDAEHALYVYAKGDHKTIIGLRTVREFIRSYTSISLNFETGLLKNVVRNDGSLASRIETATRLYVDGHIASSATIRGGEVLGSSDDRSIRNEFEEALVGRPNRLIFARSRPLVDAGGALIVLDVANLIGETGLVALFQDAGYTVARVE